MLRPRDWSPRGFSFCPIASKFRQVRRAPTVCQNCQNLSELGLDKVKIVWYNDDIMLVSLDRG